MNRVIVVDRQGKVVIEHKDILIVNVLDGCLVVIATGSEPSGVLRGWAPKEWRLWYREDEET